MKKKGSYHFLHTRNLSMALNNQMLNVDSVENSNRAWLVLFTFFPPSIVQFVVYVFILAGTDWMNRENERKSCNFENYERISVNTFSDDENVDIAQQQLFSPHEKCSFSITCGPDVNILNVDVDCLRSKYANLI